MKIKVFPLALLALGVMAYLVLERHSHADTRLLPFQGRLSDANGNPIPDGARVVQFKIYDAPVGGRVVWNGEVQKLTVNGGLVSTLLGTKADLSRVDFDRDLYLELTIDANDDGQIGPADPPLLPRQSIVPAVFAKESANSRLLDGYDWAPLFGTNNPADGTLLDAKIRDGSINGNKFQARTIHAGLVASNTLTLATLAKEVRDLLMPAGTIVAFGGIPGAVPDGWLLCDGRAVSSRVYTNLFNRIGRAWGDGSDDFDPNSDFNLPDLRGRFLRGVDANAGLDPDKASRLAIGPNGNQGDRVGSGQSDSFASHTHALSVFGSTAVAGAHTHTVERTDGIDIRWGDGGGNSSDRIDAADSDGSDPQRLRAASAGAHAHSFSVSGNTTAFGGTETRPKNAYVYYIIKH
jgi:microcystin-dependent protein